MACLKSSNGSYCLSDEVASVPGAAATSWPPFALLPPLASCSNPDVVCSSCISNQVSAIQKDPGLSAYLKPNLDAIANTKCVPKSTSSTKSGGGKLLVASTALVILAAALIF